MFFAAFQDVNVMIFLGIGYLIIILKKYGYSAVGYNFFTGAISAQWYIIVAGCLSHRVQQGLKLTSISRGNYIPLKCKYVIICVE